MGKLYRAPRHRFVVRALIFSAALSNVAVLDAHAGSNHAAASLRIEVTVVPTVRTAAVQSNTAPSTAAISYDLQSDKKAPTLTQQITIQAISTTHQGTTPMAASSNGNRNSAVLETVTIVAE